MEVNVLDVFRAKTKVRGSTPIERLENAVDRWRKVMEDCESSSDNSLYRRMYGTAHREVWSATHKILEIVNSMPEDGREALELILLHDLAQLGIAMRNEIILSAEPTGRTDALCYMVVEIEQVVNS